MKESNYYKSILTRLDFHFSNKLLSNIIMLCDEENDIIDNVVFLETDAKNVVGFYMNGMNPMISSNRSLVSDDFNLFSLYEKLSEIKRGLKSPFYIKKIKVIFHPSYNEMLAIFLSSDDNSSSMLVTFQGDEINVVEGVSLGKYINVIKNNLSQFKNIDFLIFCKNESSDWKISTK